MRNVINNIKNIIIVNISFVALVISCCVQAQLTNDMQVVIKDRAGYFGEGFIVAGLAATKPPVKNKGLSKPTIPARAVNVPNAIQAGSPHQKLPKAPAVPARGVNAPNAIQAGSPHQKLPKAPAVPARAMNAPNAIQAGSPHQKLPKAPVVPARGAVQNVGQPSSPLLRKLPPKPAQLSNNVNVTARPINTAQNAVKVFSNQLIKPFSRLAATYKHKGMVQNDRGEWIPKGSTGKLGKFLGGGYNSRVYKDKRSNKFVHKLVPLISFGKKGSTSIENLDREVSITDQLGGRAILKRFKATYKGKGLDSMVQIAEMDGKPEVWDIKGPNGNIHKFAHTKEQNISTPVFTTDSKGRQKAIKGDNGKFVLATNGFERIELRAKDSVRKQAKLKGQKIKLGEILGPHEKPVPGKKYKYRITNTDMSKAITKQEEVTINTVLRGLNHNGIAWTDHKLQNLDVVKEPKSPTGYKVIFFDFDGFRAVKGNSRLERKNKAREIQTKFDHATRDKPARVDRFDFDFTAFGSEPLPTLQSPGANGFRDNLSALDRQSPEAFNKILSNATKGQVNTTSPNI